MFQTLLCKKLFLSTALDVQYTDDSADSIRVFFLTRAFINDKRLNLI